jgi:hypothetical protein
MRRRGIVFFRDVVVAVKPESPTHALVTWTPELGDHVSETVAKPPELEGLFGTLDVLIRKAIKKETISEDEEKAKLRLAHTLYSTFFQGELGKAFHRFREQEGGVRIKILSDPMVKDTDHWFFKMPWELMIPPASKEPLSLAPDISFVRQLPEASHATLKRTLIQPDPLKILVLTTNTWAFTEEQELDEDDFAQPVIDSFASNEKVVVEVLKAPDLLKLQDALNQFKPHILHITGHGGKPEVRSEEGFEKYDQLGLFYMAKGGDFENCVIGPNELIGLLKPCLSHLRMVTLTSCYLGRSSQRGFSEGFAASLSAAGVPVVAAFQFEVSLQAAKTWMHSFFSRLAEGMRIDDAMTKARGAIFSMQSKGRQRDLEYGSPMLFSRLADGRLFRQNQIVKIISRSDQPIGTPELDQDVLDLTDYFKGTGLKDADLVKDVEWNRSLLPRLKQLKSTLSEDETITFKGQTHLSIMAAVGFLFNETCGCKLEYEQVNRYTYDREVWRSFVQRNKYSPKMLPMRSTFVEGDPDSADLIACVSISNETETDARKAFNNQPYRGLLHCRPHHQVGHDSLPTNLAALELAREIGAKIKQVAQQVNAGRVHLFFSCPLGFALFLGMQLNACRSLQLYEFQKPDYKPSFLLR